jgi:hypothetical protein
MSLQCHPASRSDFMDVQFLRNRDLKIYLSEFAEASHSLCRSMWLLSAGHFGVFYSLSVSLDVCC